MIYPEKKIKEFCAQQEAEISAFINSPQIIKHIEDILEDDPSSIPEEEYNIFVKGLEYTNFLALGKYELFFNHIYTNFQSKPEFFTE